MNNAKPTNWLEKELVFLEISFINWMQLYQS